MGRFQLRHSPLCIYSHAGIYAIIGMIPILKSQSFSRENTTTNRNMPSETEILEALKSGKLELPPIKIRLLSGKRPAADRGCDALVEAAWQEQSYKFAATVQRYSSDRAVADAIRESRDAAQKLGVLPLVITPWLAPEQLKRLESEAVSGIDLSGNGIIIVPMKWLIFRSGEPNAFPESRLVKNVYEGNTSLVSRTFLLKSSFPSIMDILREIQSRSGGISQSTVSKAIKQLQEDQIVWRDNSEIKLLQADKLLTRLADNYQLPRIISRQKIKVEADFDAIPALVASAAAKAKATIVLTGACSVNSYATMGREKQYTWYCDKEPTAIIKKLTVAADADSRFPNAEILQTTDQSVYFDTREGMGVRVASPIQTYLELMRGDKRERETAEQIGRYIMKNIDKAAAEIAK